MRILLWGQFFGLRKLQSEKVVNNNRLVDDPKGKMFHSETLKSPVGGSSPDTNQLLLMKTCQSGNKYSSQKNELLIA
eukprot:Awhi_evm1s9390